jgi:hypothetical protein
LTCASLSSELCPAMGGSVSSLVDAEKTSWVLPHDLGYVTKDREEQLSLLPKFGSQLKLCCCDRTILGLQYQHWWVTDGTWNLEFGGGELLNNTVMIHCNPRPEQYITECLFSLTPTVMQRMKNVCGATNYSLGLRNCEHVARYVHCGSWICFQMVGRGRLKEYFFNNMGTYTKLINTFPEELKTKEQNPVALYAHVPSDTINLKYIRSKEVLTALDEACYNIVILGPTGAGKSTLINNMFNLTVCQTADSVQSVTRQVKFYQGSFSWQLTGKQRLTNKVNVIDTLGGSGVLLLIE